MMRSRGQRVTEEGEVRPVSPAWQCAAPCLLYVADAQDPTKSWRSMNMEGVIAGIKEPLPLC
eukprot:10651572-Lingulodinium_polyedra.AAC.1